MSEQLTLQREMDEAAKKFSQRVVKKLTGRIDSVVLYGSAARRESRSDSDIDILVLGRRKSDWKKVSHIAHEVDSENNYSTFISTTFYTASNFKENATHGSFFARRVLIEGVVLHDNGTYKRIRQEILAAR